MHFLNDNDINKIESYLRIEQSLFALYDKLISFKLNNGKNIEQYKKWFENFEMVIEVADSLYSKLENDKKPDYIKYIKENYDVDASLTVFPPKLDKVTAAASRALVRLDFDISDRLDLEQIDEDEAKIVVMTDEKGNKKIVSYEKLMEKITKLFYEEVIEYNLNTIEEKINCCSDLRSIVQLIERKYLIIYLNKNIEKQLLNNKFAINQQILGQSKMLEPVMVQRYYNQNRESYCITRCALDIESILFNEASDEDKLINQVILKSVMLMLNEQQLGEINYFFNSYIEDSKMVKNFPSIRENEQDIRDIFIEIRQEYKNKTKKRDSF